MGMCKIDVDKAGRPYEQITFSDVTCIKGLIKLRSKLDGFTNAAHVNASNWFKAMDSASDYVGGMNQELIAVFVTLDEYIKKANLNVKQRHIVSGLMSGYTEQDLAEEWGTNSRNVASVLDTVANRIKDINDLEWKYDYVFLNIIRVNDKKVGFSYKKCIKCSESKAATRDFYSKDNRNSDGLSNRCKECDLHRKQVNKVE
jgi:hypothetical protein